MVLAVNKIDLMNYSNQVFDQIRAAYEPLQSELQFKSVTAILSALKGDNVIERSRVSLGIKDQLYWFLRPLRCERLHNHRFRFPAVGQSTNFRFSRVSGTVIAGEIEQGDEVVLPSGQRQESKKLSCLKANSTAHRSGDNATLDREIDLSE